MSSSTQHKELQPKHAERNCIACSGCSLADILSAMADSKEAQDAQTKTLGEIWAELPGLDERGAGGRIVIGPTHLTRQDLDTN